SSAVVFERIEVQAPAGSAYRVGDSLLIARMGREIPGWGNVIIPAGIGRVVIVNGDRAVTEVVSQYTRVVNELLTLPLEPFKNPGSVEPVPIENGPVGKVISIRDLHEVPGQQDWVFIDVGREAGVALGDVFEIYQKRDPNAVGGAPAQKVAVIQIAHVRRRS